MSVKKVLQFIQKPGRESEPAQPGVPHHCHIFVLPSRKNDDAANRKSTARKQTGTARKTKTRRDTLITKVKIAQKQLGIADADYRCLLSVNFGVSSCTALEERDLVRLISYFRSKGWKDAPSRKKAMDRHGKPKNLKSALHPAAPVLQRIEAILSEIGKARGTYIPWDYAAGILAKHTGLTHLDTAAVGELQKVMVALERTLKTEQRKRA